MKRLNWKDKLALLNRTFIEADFSSGGIELLYSKYTKKFYISASSVELVEGHLLIGLTSGHHETPERAVTAFKNNIVEHVNKEIKVSGLDTYKIVPQNTYPNFKFEMVQNV